MGAAAAVIVSNWNVCVKKMPQVNPHNNSLFIISKRVDSVVDWEMDCLSIPTHQVSSALRWRVILPVILTTPTLAPTRPPTPIPASFPPHFSPFPWLRILLTGFYARTNQFGLILNNSRKDHNSNHSCHHPPPPPIIPQIIIHTPK